jgi:hypothetical protein
MPQTAERIYKEKEEGMVPSPSQQLFNLPFIKLTTHHAPSFSVYAL